MRIQRSIKRLLRENGKAQDFDGVRRWPQSPRTCQAGWGSLLRKMRAPCCIKTVSPFGSQNRTVWCFAVMWFAWLTAGRWKLIICSFIEGNKWHTSCFGSQTLPLTFSQTLFERPKNKREEAWYCIVSLSSIHPYWFHRQRRHLELHATLELWKWRDCFLVVVFLCMISSDC